MASVLRTVYGGLSRVARLGSELRSDGEHDEIVEQRFSNALRTVQLSICRLPNSSSIHAYDELTRADVPWMLAMSAVELCPPAARRS